MTFPWIVMNILRNDLYLFTTNHRYGLKITSNYTIDVYAYEITCFKRLPKSKSALISFTLASRSLPNISKDSPLDSTW